MPQHKLPSIAEMVSPARNSIDDLAQIVASGELSDALRLYSEVKREAERAAAMVCPSTSSDEQLETEGKSVSLYNFSCSLCNEIFENENDLTSHNCLHDPNVNVMYECQDCKTLFQTLDGLAQHMKIHEENIVVIRSSMVHKHSPKKNIGYVCPICDKVLSSRGSVIKHQELHKGLKPYVCSFCGKCFSIKGNRNKHEQIHIGEKPHKCHICEKSFTFKGNLTKHLLTHTNFKQYKCELCDKDFTLKGNLDKHMKRHEKGLKVRPKIKEVNLDEHAEMQEMDLKPHVIDGKITDGKGAAGDQETSFVTPGPFKINVKVIETSVKSASSKVVEKDTDEVDTEKTTQNKDEGGVEKAA